MPAFATQELSIRTDDGVELSCEQSGSGCAIVLLHGLSATRRYVVMGSRTLEREGYRTIAYDARGHGRSTAAPDPKSYGYERLACDLEAVLDTLGLQRAVLAGASMGAHTAVRFALSHPERVAALGLITPSFDPGLPLPPEHWHVGTRSREGCARVGRRGSWTRMTSPKCRSSGEAPWRRCAPALGRARAPQGGGRRA